MTSSNLKGKKEEDEEERIAGLGEKIKGKMASV